MSDAFARFNEQWEQRVARAEAVRLVLVPERYYGFAARPTKEVVLGPYLLRVYRNRYVEEGEGMKSRSIRIELQLGEHVVGAGQFEEWWVYGTVVPLDIWNAADGISQEEGELMELLCSFWPWHDWPLDYGTAVLFTRLAIDPKLDWPHLALRTLGSFLPMEFGRRASFMAMKCFPLEFENAINGDEARERLYRRRLHAMKRMYTQHLGVTPISSSYPGWMWRRFRFCPDPLPFPQQGWLEGEYE